MNKDNLKIRIIAAAITLLVAALIVLMLLFTRLYGSDSDLTARAPQPPADEEEIFLDAEFEEVPTEQDNPDVIEPDEEAAAPQGEPDKAEEENPQIKVADKKLPKEPVKQPKEVTQKQPSEVKTKNTSNNDKENKAISSKVGGAFNKNGNNKNEGGSGTGDVGLGVSGLSGRKRLTDPNLKPIVEKAVTIKVKVTVNEAGKVISASFHSDSGAGAGNKTLRNQCVEAAKNIKWSEKKGAPDESGILTFKLTPPKSK